MAWNRKRQGQKVRPNKLIGSCLRFEMNTHLLRLIFVVLGIAGPAMTSGCRRSSAEPANPASPQPIAVRLIQTKSGAITRIVTLPAEIKAFQQATLYAKIPGYLKSIYVDKGDTVKQGDLLAEIEAPELMADAAKFKADLDLAELDLKRTAQAQQQAPDLVVAQSVDNAKGRFLAAKANLERAETLLSFTRIVAPFAGTVTRRYVDVGAFIPAATSGGSPQTSAMLTLADMNKVRLQVAVPDNEVKFVNKSMPIIFTVDGLPGNHWQTKVSRVSMALDETTKTMLAEADVENPNRDLRPGMYASAKLSVETKPDVLLLPAEAVLVEKAKTSVFVVEAGRAKKLPVKTGFFDGAAFELVNGLSPGTPVILFGKQTLNDGQPVQVSQ